MVQRVIVQAGSKDKPSPNVGYVAHAAPKTVVPS